jgi:hypothetical protein
MTGETYRNLLINDSGELGYDSDPGDSVPELDNEVIANIDNDDEIYAVVDSVDKAVAFSELTMIPKDISIEDPDTSASGLVQLTYPFQFTITRIWCSTDVGTVTIQFDERAEATPNTDGTDVMTAVLVCDDDTQATTSFANANIAANVPVNLDIDAVASSPTQVRIHVLGRIQ